MQDEYISKSQRKRDCDAIRALGEALIGLRPHDLQLISLPPHLSEAIAEARRITSRSGQKRQRQYVGKLMRDIDIESIKTQLKQIQHRQDTSNAHFHQLEQWRDELVGGNEDTLSAIITACPQVDRQHLRQLVKQARNEHRVESGLRTQSRKLFRYLSNLDSRSEP